MNFTFKSTTGITMSGLRQKQNATTKKNSTTRNVNTRGGGSTIREVESPQKSRKKNGPPRDDEDNARADAIAEARRDAEAEIEAVEHHTDVTPPPEIPTRGLGPAAATGDRARALVQKEANNKAAEAEKKAAKLTAELEEAKALLQKERKKRQRENEEEASISKPRRSSSNVVSSRKKAVSTVNYVIKF